MGHTAGLDVIPIDLGCRICDMLGGKEWAGRDSAVDVATRFGLEVRGSNPGGGEIVPTRPDRPWGPPSLGVKAAGACL